MAPTLYHRISGGSLERLAALSDGVFAIVMTLLVLEIRIPTEHPPHSQNPVWVSGALRSESLLWHRLGHIAPLLLVYLLSFLTLGIFWMGQQTQLNHFDRGDRRLTWTYLLFLLAVTLMPFSTSLLGAFITYRLALGIYWLNLLLLGVLLYLSLDHAVRAGLLKTDVSADVIAAMRRRIVVYQLLYAFGASLAIVNTYLSIGFLVLMQLNSVITPRFGWLDRF
ncbi:MAG: TMEM175 family protein [Actinomycetota bacterium]